MVEKPYEFLEEYTADIGFIAYGDSLEELFINAAKALTEIQTELNKVNPKECIEISVEAPDLLSLLRNWLEEFLYLRDVENMFFSEFHIKELIYMSKDPENKWKLKAQACGEKIDLNRHTPKVEIKAISYYDMEICQKGFTYHAKVLVDI